MLSHFFYPTQIESVEEIMSLTDDLFETDGSIKPIRVKLTTLKGDAIFDGFAQSATIAAFFDTLIRDEKHKAAKTLTPRRRLEYIRGLAGALIHWRQVSGTSFAELARRAGVRRDTITGLTNRPTMRYGPRDAGFYEKLYEVEIEEPGYFTPEVRRILLVLTNRYQE